MKRSDIRIEEKSQAVLTVTFDDVRKDWQQWFLLSSDRHHDSTKCDQKLEKEHLDLAKQRGAYILDFGDMFDAMQGKQDKRNNLAELRPELVGREDYYGTLVDYHHDFYKPYAQNFLMIGKGNHETSVISKCGTDMVSNLVGKLNQSRKSGQVYIGGYGGWVKFLFVIQKTKRTSLNLKYMHGWGGGGPVTRGVIDTNRQAVYLPDADIVVNGHTHDNYYLPVSRERLTDQGNQYKDLLHFIRTPGYKDDFNDGARGWSVETGKPPKPRGCVWMRLYMDSRNQIGVEFTSGIV